MELKRKLLHCSVRTTRHTQRNGKRTIIKLLLKICRFYRVMTNLLSITWGGHLESVEFVQYSTFIDDFLSFIIILSVVQDFYILFFANRQTNWIIGYQDGRFKKIIKKSCVFKCEGRSYKNTWMTTFSIFLSDIRHQLQKHLSAIRSVWVCAQAASLETNCNVTLRLVLTPAVSVRVHECIEFVSNF